jgi:hypothetical protein
MSAESKTHFVENAEQIHSTRPCLVVMLTVSALWGFCAGLLPEDSAFIVLLTNVVPVLLLSCMVLWCYLDSYRYDEFLRRRFYLCLLACPIVVYPYYIFRTRGLSGFITLGLSIAFAAACYFLALVGAELGYALVTVV